jgi:hypothetical protein
VARAYVMDKLPGKRSEIPLVSLPSLPDAIHKPILEEICRSVNRVVTAAHASITNRRVNVFNQ